MDLPSLVVGIIAGGLATSVGFAFGCWMQASSTKLDRIIAELLEEES